MKKELQLAVNKFERGEATEVPLSAGFLEASRRRRSNVIRARLAVFARQNAKKGKGKDISDEIAHAYRPLTLSSQYAAILRGFQDRRAAGGTALSQPSVGTRKRPWETLQDRVSLLSSEFEGWKSSYGPPLWKSRLRQAETSFRNLPRQPPKNVGDEKRSTGMMRNSK
eukprot:Nitzschia sp. Nitz4//scaffold5_size260463//235169//235684//NITZ4_001027-RA/size260463-snap-gene-0.29-mRNA-1//1//CDS//3329555475//7590//frame0